MWLILSSCPVWVSQGEGGSQGMYVSESVLWFLAGLLRGRILFQSPAIISQQYPNKYNWSMCPRPMLPKRCMHIHVCPNTMYMHVETSTVDHSIGDT